MPQDTAIDASATDRLQAVRDKIAKRCEETGREPSEVVLVAVSKTFDASAIRPVIRAGQRVFGENRVQEALGKWPALKAETPGIQLHLIGPLQSNKTKEAVALFDVIESVDREKIARAIATECEKTGKALTVFVQVNTGEEPQKAGVSPAETASFAAMCRDTLGLNVAGLMCIPPIEEEPALHFALLDKLAFEAGVEGRSMGMSADFETAIGLGATQIRVGSAIFGPRG